MDGRQMVGGAGVLNADLLGADVVTYLIPGLREVC
jgi:hypothetical protein